MLIFQSNYTCLNVWVFKGDSVVPLTKSTMSSPQIPISFHFFVLISCHAFCNSYGFLSYDFLLQWQEGLSWARINHRSRTYTYRKWRNLWISFTLWFVKEAHTSLCRQGSLVCYSGRLSKRLLAFWRLLRAEYDWRRFAFILSKVLFGWYVRTTDFWWREASCWDVMGFFVFIFEDHLRCQLSYWQNLFRFLILYLNWLGLYCCDFHCVADGSQPLIIHESHPHQFCLVLWRIMVFNWCGQRFVKLFFGKNLLVCLQNSIKLSFSFRLINSNSFVFKFLADLFE